jgi:hypothetical protein
MKTEIKGVHYHNIIVFVVLWSLETFVTLFAYQILSLFQFYVMHACMVFSMYI